MINKVVHFEIPANDPEKTMNFFQSVFGWTFQKFGEAPYWFVKTGDDKAPGINGAIMQRRDPQQPLTHSILVENMDETIRKIEISGGQVVVPKMAIQNMGWAAYFKDPDGIIHGIWEVDEQAG